MRFLLSNLETYLPQTQPSVFLQCHLPLPPPPLLAELLASPFAHSTTLVSELLFFHSRKNKNDKS